MPSGFFALRSPLLPFAALRAWGDGLEGAARPDDPAAWARDRDLARDRLRAWLANPEVREAIRLASPALDERVPAWLAVPDAEPGVEAGLVKYLARMMARGTPFGTFASSSVGALGRATSLELPGRAHAVRHTRLDMDYLSEVVARLAADPGVRARVTLSPNSSLYPAGDSLRYAEARRVDGARAYYLVNVGANEGVTAALAAAREGATLDQVAATLAGDDVPLEDARAFVHQLVDAQLLVPDLGPLVTGEDALADLLARLAAVAPEHAARATLAAARERLAALDAGGLGAGAPAYAEAARGLDALAPADPARLFQVDLFRPSTALVLEEGLVDEMLRAADLMVGLFLHGRRDPLEEFRLAFEARWGDREVPLMDALDEERGIGFAAGQGPGSDPSPLLAGLPFLPPRAENQQAWGERAQFVQWRLAEAIARGDAEIRFEPAELERFREPGAPGLPGAFHLMGTLLAPAEGDPAAPRAVLESAAGPSGARLMGRFGHGDPELLARVREHLRAEEALQPGLVHAEIVHLPEGRIGNVLARPLLRDHEIAYLGASGAPRERTLSVLDLTVRLEAGGVALRSRRLGRDVRPRLTSAHYTGWKSLGVYRFLAALQAEGVVEGVSWHWGPLEHQPRLPRVRMGRLVLSRQTWNASAAEAKRLRAHDGHAAFREVQRWRAARGLPRFVGLSNADNVLPVDLDQPLSVQAFLAEISGHDPFALQELLPGADADAVRTPEGGLTNEIVIPVVRRAAPAAPARVPAPGAGADRTAPDGAFQPGSEWLTLKLYAGPATVDRVLVEAVAPVLEALLGERAIDGAFFVRYADPDWHVRVRLHGEPHVLLATALPRLRDGVVPLLADGAVHRLQLDPYLRETVRYGGDAAIAECEAIFGHDSRAAFGFLALATGERGLDARWRFALLGMDRLMDDFGLPLAARRELVAGQARAFAREFEVDSGLRKRMMARYRDERGAIESLLMEAESADGGGDALLAAGRALLAARSGAIRPHVEAIQRLERDGRLTVTIPDLLASLLHMHANRVLRSSQRAQELVLHHWLENAYGSRLARAPRPEERA